MQPASIPQNLDAPDKESVRFEFTGTGGEYFGIWLANLVLSILTVGIFSAWAKVRRRRYFLGNTKVLGDGFEYHATGIMILKGRLVALAVFAAYFGVGLLDAAIQAVFAIVGIFILPWAINRSNKFNARMTSWRNVRFDWNGTYWGVAKVTLLWPVLAFISLGILLPFSARASREYTIRCHSLGRAPFSAAIPVSQAYRALGKTFLFGGVLLALAPFAIFLGDHFLTFIQQNEETILYAVLLVAIALPICFQMFMRNVAINAMSLGNMARFRSDIHVLRFLWIVVSNLVVTVFSFLLLYPWAAVRSYRYQASCIAVVPLVDDTGLVDAEIGKVGAVGEEYTEFADAGFQL